MEYKKMKNKLKLGVHSIIQSMSPFLSQQILKKKYAGECNVAPGGCVVYDDKHLWSHNNNTQLDRCLYENGSCNGIFDHSHAC